MNTYLTAQQRVDELTYKIVEQIFVYVEDEELSLGPDYGQHLIMTLLEALVGTIVARTLNSNLPVKKPKNDVARGQAFLQTVNATSVLKIEMQNAVAYGYMRGMESFTKVPMEYYCEIKPIPESVNKEPC